MSAANAEAMNMRRELCRRSFSHFARWFWPVVTGLPFPDNHASRAVIAVLQAVGDGRIVRLLIAMPPGVGKSTLLALYAAWRLARRADWRGIHAMHASTDAERESRRVRRLIESDLFRAMFPIAFRVDENTAAAWATTEDGRYYAVGTDTTLTSKRVHEAVCDDPLNATDRHSRAARQKLWVWFIEGLQSRLDGDRAPQIVVQQRLDRDDLIGRCLESGEPWTLLELAAEFDPARRCEVLDTDGQLVWRDERAEPGELLAPQMLSKAKLDGLRVNASMFATQYLQRPADDENATIKRTWWRFHHGVNVLPTAPRPLGCNTDVPAIATPEQFARIVIACDLTFGGQTATSDFVSIQAWGAFRSGRFLLARFHKKCGLLDSVAAVTAMRLQFPYAEIIVEKAANGRGSIEELKAAGVHGVIGVNPLGSKRDRIALVSATIEAGDAYLPLGLPGLADFVEELAGATRHDDEQDACAYALHRLNQLAVHEQENGSAPASGMYLGSHETQVALHAPSLDLTSPVGGYFSRGRSRTEEF